jgi:WD40 repeat protein
MRIAECGLRNPRQYIWFVGQCRIVYADVMRIGRRQFVAGMAGAAAAAVGHPLAAAPFVPARDPQCVAFAPGGTMVATGCSGMTDGTFPPRPHPDVRKCGVVAVWDVATGKRLFRWETFGDLVKLAFSPDGPLLAAARLFETDDGLALHEVRVWDVTTGRLVKSLDRCHSFDFSPDGRQLAVLSRSKCALYDVKDWGKETLIKPLGGAVSVSFAADGLSLVGVVTDKGKYRLRLASLDGASAGETPAPRAAGETPAPQRQSLPLDEPFYRVAVTADGSLLATGHNGGNIVIWDAMTLDVRSRLKTGERGLAHPFFSPNPGILAAGCQENGDVVIWNLAERQEVGRFTFEKGGLRTYQSRPANAVFRPEKDPTRFCFSHDGEAFLVGCYGGILRATSGGQELRRFGD